MGLGEHSEEVCRSQEKYTAAMTVVLQPLEYFFLWLCMSGSWHISVFFYTQEHGTGKNVAEPVPSQVGPATGCLSWAAYTNED